MTARTTDRPLILAEVSPLARYGHLDVLAELSDFTARRRRPIWLVLPQLRGRRGALVDGKTVQLGSPGQFLPWLQPADLVPSHGSGAADGLGGIGFGGGTAPPGAGVGGRPAGAGRRRGSRARQAGVLQAWESDYNAAQAAQRTAATWSQWRNERVTQAAVAWVLLTVFARYCEDNALVSPRWIGGADADQRSQALDARRAYFQAHPEHTDREWLGQIIAHFGKFTATAALVDSFSPLHLVAPSGDAARALLEFWWQQDDDGQPLYGFNGIDTRFLGDAYQDLSEHAKKTYALLQTPEFVEEFILDQTLEPALADRPLEGFTVIDPTCGSGHFLLGAFAPPARALATPRPRVSARGNSSPKPSTASTASTSTPSPSPSPGSGLLVAALHAAGDTSIEQQIGYTPHLAAGDSLLWGAPQQALDDDLLTLGQTVRADATENTAALKEILHRHHDVVVGNPPYITPKDAALNATYRQMYRDLPRQYALTVPFMELLFHLAHPSGQERPAGWVGQITSNSFMKREFGSKLIEQFLPTVDLRMVIDTSGAYIPGHGTPTVIIMGRNQRPSARHSARGARGAGRAGRPDVPAKGLVWSSIVEHVDEPASKIPTSGHRSPRSLFNGTHGACPAVGPSALESFVELPSGRLGAESAENRLFSDSHEMMFSSEPSTWPEGTHCLGRPLGRRRMRDWAHSARGRSSRITRISAACIVLKPTEQLRYSSGHSERHSESRTTFGGETTGQSRPSLVRVASTAADTREMCRLSITFAFVATHNHFVLDRGGKVFKQTAPVSSCPRARR